MHFLPLMIEKKKERVFRVQFTPLYSTWRHLMFYQGHLAIEEASSPHDFDRATQQGKVKYRKTIGSGDWWRGKPEWVRISLNEKDVRFTGFQSFLLYWMLFLVFLQRKSILCSLTHFQANKIHKNNSKGSIYLSNWNKYCEFKKCMHRLLFTKGMKPLKSDFVWNEDN